MGIIYFDICAIPLFLIILFVCYSRKMNIGKTNHLFISLVLISLISVIADLAIEIPQGKLPLSDSLYIICNIFTYFYLVVRNATNVVLVLFLLHLTKTSFLIKKIWVKVAFSLPYITIIILLMLNPFNHGVFIVTREAGYARGPLMIVLYIIAALYGVVGLVYSIYCRRYLDNKKWYSLLSIYILAYAAVFVQFFYPKLLLELFFTSVGEMLVMLAVVRVEERMDSEVGMLSFKSYKYDIRNIIRSHEHVQIIVVQLLNGSEIRNYLGDTKYNEYLSKIASYIRLINWRHPHRVEIYIERPGTIYIITEEDDPIIDGIGNNVILSVGEKVREEIGIGIRSKMRICLINCPKDLSRADDIISLGQKFTKIDKREQVVINASEIVNSGNFKVLVHVEEILNKAIKENHIEMYYQPIYDVHSKSFLSAEALVRISDPKYGLIPPGAFISAAEEQGQIIPLGDEIMDQVFRFVSENDLEAIGIHYIEMNLSVAQIMDASLPDKLKALQEKYNVNPSQINLEITETVYENVGEVMLENINKLIDMGYTFALDDYGTGYSNIQRVNKLPLKLIKIDKSVLDEVYTDNGRTIFTYTMQMMQKTGKEVVVEGAETIELIKILEDMGCDYIQGFYFSKPITKSEFISFIEKKNKVLNN